MAEIMTKEQLTQIYFINREIEMWEKELDDIREESLLRSRELTGMPFSNTNETSDPVAELAVRMNDVEMIILGKKKQLEYERKRILLFITEIPDSALRQIVKYRCVDCKDWETIGNLVGYERTTCAKKFKTFLKELSQKSHENKNNI